jgi:hypothetical protein
MNLERRQFLRQVPAFRPRLERLERRDCPSCTVFQREDTLVILGDDRANLIEIAATRDEGPEESDEGPEERIVVSCDGGEPQRFTGVVHVEIDTLGGADEVRAAFTDPPEPILQVRADLGGGNDVFAVAFDPQPDPPLPARLDPALGGGWLQLDVHGGQGSDQMSLALAATRAEELRHFDTNVDAQFDGGDDGDTFAMDLTNVVIGGQFNLSTDGGDGDDQWGLHLGDFYLDGAFAITTRAGGGNDDWQMSLGEVMLEGDFSIVTAGGAGNDRLRLDAILPCVEPEGRALFALRGNSGDDRLAVLVDGAGDLDGPAEIEGSLQIDLAGGGGNDTAALDIPTLDIIGTVMVNFDGSRGDDEFRMHVASDVHVYGLLDIRAVGGAGNEMFDLLLDPCYLPAGRGNVAFDGGVGNDTLSASLRHLENEGQLAIELDGGGGNDRLSLGAVEPCYLPGSETRIALSGDADDDRIDVSLDDPEIEGLLSLVVGGGGGNDIVESFIVPCLLPGGRGSFMFDLGAGDDQFMMNVGHGEMAGAMVMSAHGGEGNDQLAFSAVDPCILPESETRIGLFGGDGDDRIDVSLDDPEIEGRFDLAVSGGVGNDIVDALLEPCLRPTGRGSFLFDLGAGDDQFVMGLGHAEVEGALAIDVHGGGGNDRVAFGAIEPCILPESETRIGLFGGDGDDRIDVSLDDPEIEGRFDLEVAGGDGSDVVNSFIVPCLLPGGRASFAFDLGAGDDSLVIDVEHGEMAGAMLMSAHGGGGNDRLAFRAIDPCFLPGSDTRMTLSGDAGDDQIDVWLHPAEVNGLFNFAVLSGGGNDIVNAFLVPCINAGGRGNLLFDLGEGDDQFRFDFGEGEMGGLLFIAAHGGGGNDRLQFGGVDPCFMPGSETRIGLFGDGGDDRIEVSLDDPEIEGLFDLAVSGGGGDDVLNSFIVPCVRPEGRANLLFDGEAGNDHVAVLVATEDDDDTGALDVRVLGGLGDDDLTLALMGVDELSFLSALVDGGRQIDVARVTSNVRVINCEKIIALDEPR